MKKIIISILTAFSIYSAQWERLESFKDQETSLLFKLSDTLYAANNNRLHFTTDEGITWKSTTEIAQDIDFISCAIINKNKLFIGSLAKGIYYTSDHGTSWNSFSVGLNSSETRSINSFAVRDNKIYTGTYGGGVYYNNLDNLTNWTSFNNGLFWNVTYTINSLYNDNGTLIAGGGASASIQLNEMNSNMWSDINFAPFNANGTSLLAVKNFNNKLIGVFSQGIAISIDKGKTWEVLNGVNGNYEKGKIVEHDNRLIAMLSRAGFARFYISNNSGNSWSLLSQLNNIFTYDFEIVNRKLFTASFDGIYKFNIATVPVEDEVSPFKFSLEQNYPNPFNPNTSIVYSVPSNEYVSLNVYDVLGNKIAALVDEQKQAGIYEINFDGSKLSSGVYFYKLEVGKNKITKKMNLIK